jgi:hypothetical protein
MTNNMRRPSRLLLVSDLPSVTIGESKLTYITFLYAQKRKAKAKAPNFELINHVQRVSRPRAPVILWFPESKALPGPGIELVL